jgi:16S rRNA (guanine1207-N2)-methyltransferase
MAALVLAHLDRPAPRVLVAGDTEANIAGALAARGATVAAWNRDAGRGQPASAWPGPGEFDEGVLRMPRVRASFEMALHALAARLVAGGSLWVVGTNDEGVRSAAGRIEVLFEDVRTVEARGHGRLFRARRRQELPGLRPELGDWRSVGSLDLPGGKRPWITYPGLFAKGGVDRATAFLLETLPPLPDGCRVLDFGCGSGIIGAALEQRGDRVELDQLDADAVAVVAARENLPGARTWLGFHLDAIPGATRWDRLLSNPPIHESVLRSYRVLEELAAALGARLATDGEAWLVCQRQVPIQATFGAAGMQTSMRAERDGFRVWQVKR